LKTKRRTRIQFPGNPYYGGPGTFQKQFTNELLKKDFIKVIKPYSKNKPDLIFVVNGTKRLFFLLMAKFKGVKIAQRVDGITLNLAKTEKNLIAIFLFYVRFFLVTFTANLLSDVIIFQSNFIKSQWNKFLLFKKKYKIIYNGVDTELFRPNNVIKQYDIVCVEGSINTNYAIQILNSLIGFNVTVVGEIRNDLKNKIINKNITFTGRIEREEIVEILNSHKVYLCLEEYPPCPNSVIEAMSCNIPVVGFDTGSLRELVPYSDLLVNLKLDKQIPTSESLKKLSNKLDQVIKNYKKYNVRSHVLKNHNIEYVSNKYLDFIKLD